MPLVAGAVVFEEGVAVGAEGERHVEDLGVVERLLHAGADGVVVVLGLDDGERDVRLVVEEVVGLLRFAALDRLAADDDPALGEVDLLANLGHHVPLAAVGADERGRDELGADVGFGEFLLVHTSRQRWDAVFEQRSILPPLSAGLKLSQSFEPSASNA